MDFLWRKVSTDLFWPWANVVMQVTCNVTKMLSHKDVPLRNYNATLGHCIFAFTVYTFVTQFSNMLRLILRWPLWPLANGMTNAVLQVTVNVTKMVSHEDHDTFSSPENLCLIEVTSSLWRATNSHQFSILSSSKLFSFQFSSSVALSDHVSPLPLAQVFFNINSNSRSIMIKTDQAGEDVFEGDECVIMGWGGIKEGGQVGWFV